jgi:tetratricopeptide (TPR) repeat protein
VPLPPSPELRAQVAKVRGELSEVKATRVARSAHDGRSQAAKVVTAAQATGYRPLEAEALLERELAESEDAEFAPAEATLEQAIWAAEAGRADELEASALVRLMVVERLAGKSPEDVLALRPRVTAVLERMGGNEPIAGRFHAVVAQLLLAHDDYAGAKLEAQASLTMLEKHGGPDDPELADTIDALGAIAADEGHLSDALDHFARSLTLRRRAYGPAHPLVLTALRRLGNVLIKARRPFEAIAILEQALVLFERGHAARHPDIADTLYHLGIAYQTTGATEHAVTLLARAVAESDQGMGSQTATVGDFLTAQGYALMTLGRFEEARRTLLQALAVYEHTDGPENTSCAYALRHLAQTEIALHVYDDARGHAGRAVAIWVKALGPDTPQMIDALLLVGLAEVEAKRPAQAVAPLERALKVADKDTDPIALAQVQFVLAEALLGENHARAVALARAARQGFASDPGQQANVAEVDGWLASHAH